MADAVTFRHPSAAATVRYLGAGRFHLTGDVTAAWADLGAAVIAALGIDAPIAPGRGDIAIELDGARVGWLRNHVFPTTAWMVMLPDAGSVAPSLPDAVIAALAAVRLAAPSPPPLDAAALAAALVAALDHPAARAAAAAALAAALTDHAAPAVALDAVMHGAAAAGARVARLDASLDGACWQIANAAATLELTVAWPAYRPAQVELA